MRDKNAIDSKKQELYSRNAKQEELERKKFKKKNYAIRDSWKEEEDHVTKDTVYRFSKKKKMTLFTKIFLFSLFFFLASVFFVLFVFYFDKNEQSFNDVNISIVGPNSVESSEDLDFSIFVQNRNSVDLNSLDLSVYYPEGSIDPDTGLEKRKDVFKIESLQKNAASENKAKVAILGFAGERKDIKLAVQYDVKGFSGIYNKNKIYNIVITSAPVSLRVENNKEAISSSEEKIKIFVKSTSTTDVNDIVLNVQYPNGFSYKSSNVEPVFRDYVFPIGTLKPSEEREIEIVGSISGQDGQEKIFNIDLGVLSGLDNHSIKTKLAERQTSFLLQKPPLSIVLDSPNKDFVFVPGDVGVFEIKLENQLPGRITDVVFEIDVPTELVHLVDIEVDDGYYNSNIGKIVWNKNTLGFLEEINSFESIETAFYLPFVSLGDLAGFYKNPETNLKLKISGTSFNASSGSSSFEHSVDKKIKFKTGYSFEESITHSTGPFTNIGPIKPKANKKSSYTVSWKMFAPTSDLEDLGIRTTLPIYVEFNGKIYPEDANIKYDSDTREIIWKEDKIKAFSGYRFAPHEIFFGIDFIPSLNQINTTPTLINKKTITVEDSFTKQIYKNTPPSSDSDLEKDPQYFSGQGTVDS